MDTVYNKSFSFSDIITNNFLNKTNTNHYIKSHKRVNLNNTVTNNNNNNFNKSTTLNIDPKKSNKLLNLKSKPCNLDQKITRNPTKSESIRTTSINNETKKIECYNINKPTPETIEEPKSYRITKENLKSEVNFNLHLENKIIHLSNPENSPNPEFSTMFIIKPELNKQLVKLKSHETTISNPESSNNLEVSESYNPPDIAKSKNSTILKNTKVINYSTINPTLISKQSINLSSIESSDHLVIPIILNHEYVIIQTQAMIDSGATSSFIDTNFIKEHNLPLERKSSPIPLYVIDGRPVASGEITHNTIPLTLSITNHSEKLSFDVTQLGTYPIILGIP